MSFNTFGKLFRFTTWGESHGASGVDAGRNRNCQLAGAASFIDEQNRVPL